MSLTIKRSDILSDDAQALIAELDAELSARYPEERVNMFQLPAEEIASGRGAFLVALRDGRAVGCGALRRVGDGAGEIKRMYVRREERGRGVAHQLMIAIETEAQALGLATLLLETGVRQPEAIKLYERFGFRRIPAFGDYVESPLSLCMSKPIATAPTNSP